LTDIASVLNNRLRNRKKRFFDTKENWVPRDTLSRLRGEKHQP